MRRSGGGKWRWEAAVGSGGGMTSDRPRGSVASRNGCGIPPPRLGRSCRLEGVHRAANTRAGDEPAPPAHDRCGLTAEIGRRRATAWLTCGKPLREARRTRHHRCDRSRRFVQRRQPATTTVANAKHGAPSRERRAGFSCCCRPRGGRETGRKSPASRWGARSDFAPVSASRRRLARRLPFRPGNVFTPTAVPLAVRFAHPGPGLPGRSPRDHPAARSRRLRRADDRHRPCFERLACVECFERVRK